MLMVAPHALAPREDLAGEWRKTNGTQYDHRSYPQTQTNMKDKAQLLSKHVKSLVFTLVGLLLSFGAIAQERAAACGELSNHYGPFDYRTDQGPKIDIVNQYHFTPNVEALVRGQAGSIAQDLSYTLKVVPNHHRALLAMMRYGQRLKSPHVKDAGYSVDCYFQRALRFRSDDTVARLMYANYLTNHGRRDEALLHIEQVGAKAGENAFTHYNMGLAYLELKEYEKALAQAHKAMALGFLQSALRDKLAEAGHWRDPPEPMPAVTANSVDK